MQSNIIIHPIGEVESEFTQRYETPRQGVLSSNMISIIKLYPNNNFEQAVKGLEGFERIWVVFNFNLNNNWNPMVSPPGQPGIKVGVFATRAPYRPNQIGLSCVKLEKVEGLNIYISESDILNGSPVLDIKPYLPYTDSFPDIKTGWAQTDPGESYLIIFSAEAEREAESIKMESGANIAGYARVQLQFNPADITRKRISADIKQNTFILSYQRWKIIYNVDDITKIVNIQNIL
jgi:tRNA (adenine37-N6)-methyltransferase